MAAEDASRDLSRRSFVRSAAAATAGVAATAGATGAGVAQETHTVDMTDGLVFDPETITVTAGDTVVWENVGNIGHSVTAYEEDIPEDAEYWASGGFDSEQAARSNYPEGDVPGGESYSHTFETPGTHEYFCVPHEAVDMVGTVEVEERSGGGGTTPQPAPSGDPIVPRGPALQAVVVGTAAVAAVGTVYEVLRQQRGRD